MHHSQLNEKLAQLRHSTAHLLAAAVMKLWPDTKRAIGPAIENGFYFDFEFSQSISETDLPTIEKKMHEIAPTWKSFEKHELTASEAKKEYPDNPYKHELIGEFSKGREKVGFYKSGDYWDLCAGGHCDHPDKQIKHFKLMSLAGAYWRGDEKNKMLTRIYGTIFPTKKELNDYLTRLEEAKKRDHRKLGQALGLFVISENVGPGLPLYTPKGTTVLYEIKNFSRELRRTIGYQEVQTPQMNKGRLFKLSGHYEKFRDTMFLVRSNYTDEEYFLKPMNCPQHTQIYASEHRSYRDLPIRFSDFSLLYRDEKPGELSGLARLRCFSQDDAHCFMRKDQIEGEFDSVLNVIRLAMAAYGMQYHIRLSLRDEKNTAAYLGDAAAWEESQTLLKKLLHDRTIEHVVAPGEAAFYGPKMDLIAKDSLGREWQISTIQLDFNMPSRFGLTYTDSTGKKQTPIMMHSALVGSPERFFGILLEHYAGSFPLWLSPIQVRLVPISNKFNNVAAEWSGEFSTLGIRVDIDQSDETVGNKIRKSSTEKIPYAIVLGEQEMKSDTISVRVRGSRESVTITRSDFLKKITHILKFRSPDLALK